jgi:hypothetical protein
MTMLRIRGRWSVRAAFACVVLALAGALAFAQAPPGAPPDERAAEASIPKRYPVVPLAERQTWDDVMPQTGRHVSAWNGHIVVADVKGITYSDLTGKTVNTVPFPEKASAIRPLRAGATNALDELPVRDFPGFEYNDESTKPERDQIVFLDERGTRQSSFTVTGRWRTALSPGARVLVKFGELGVPKETPPLPDTAGYDVYDRKGTRLARVENESRLFFADVNDAGSTLAFEKEKTADKAPLAEGVPSIGDNRVIGFALLSPAGKVLLRQRAERIDQLAFTPSGRHAVVGTVEKDGSGALRRRTRFYDANGKQNGEIRDMAGMLFGQVAGQDELILTRCKSAEEQFRWAEVLVVDAGTGTVKKRLACDVAALGVRSFISKDGALFVSFDPYGDRLAPLLNVYALESGATLFSGEMFHPPASELLNFVRYGDGVHLLLSSAHRLWLTSAAIVRQFTGQAQAK